MAYVMTKSRNRKFETLTPHGGPKSTTAKDVQAHELMYWRDSSMDLMRGLDVIELPHGASVKPRIDPQPPLLWERRQRRREPR
jgi:hypothetical protein